jgi:site-specific DNA-cytosine methylase
VIIFDFFSGTGSSTKAFEDAGHTVYRFELDDSFEATEHADIMNLTAEYLMSKYGRPDFIWASPPCTFFSVAAIGKNWISGGDNPTPRNDGARFAQELVRHTVCLDKRIEPNAGLANGKP